MTLDEYDLIKSDLERMHGLKEQYRLKLEAAETERDTLKAKVDAFEVFIGSKGLWDEWIEEMER